MTLGVCIAGILGMGSLPYFLKRTGAITNQQTSQKPLTGSQRQRGLYINAGNQDVGPDPDWDLQTMTWKGKRNNVDENREASKVKLLKEATNKSLN